MLSSSCEHEDVWTSFCQAENTLQEIADRLEFPEGSPERQHFFDLADAERGRIPQDIMNEENLVANLPVVFRTLRGDAPTEKELRKLATLIMEARKSA